MKYFFLLLTLIVALSSCSTNTQKKDISSNVTGSGKTENTLPLNKDDIQEPLQNISQTGSDMSAFLGDSNTDTIGLSYTSGQKSSITFINTDPSTLKVKINFLGKDGNLRLSQIIMPDGTSDGPF
jgi:hypothetical protein